MKKKYSKMWQRYFVRLLDGEPMYLEPEQSARSRECQRGTLGIFMDMVCGSTMYYRI